jgi:hypothetical protein
MFLTRARLEKSQKTLHYPPLKRTSESGSDGSDGTCDFLSEWRVVEGGAFVHL